MNIFKNDEYLKNYILAQAKKYPNAGYSLDKITTFDQVDFLGLCMNDAAEVLAESPDCYNTIEEATEACFDNAWQAILKNDF